eukprot:TRINITY_DN6928_c0_g1_i1.p1 TRINITY_DN6928_c0_g1~~TRINITY_DN6928_c0_g1_i1.p1  ORF type:complete len:963 (+),score=155.37 TRINITY_DN6928_c0_g1_i1:375-3263(+)
MASALQASVAEDVPALNKAASENRQATELPSAFPDTSTGVLLKTEDTVEISPGLLMKEGEQTEGDKKLVSHEAAGGQVVKDKADSPLTMLEVETSGASKGVAGAVAERVPEPAEVTEAPEPAKVRASPYFFSSVMRKSATDQALLDRMPLGPTSNTVKSPIAPASAAPKSGQAWRKNPIDKIVEGGPKSSSASIVAGRVEQAADHGHATAAMEIDSASRPNGAEGSQLSAEEPAPSSALLSLPGSSSPLDIPSRVHSNMLTTAEKVAVPLPLTARQADIVIASSLCPSGGGALDFGRSPLSVTPARAAQVYEVMRLLGDKSEDEALGWLLQQAAPFITILKSTALLVQSHGSSMPSYPNVAADTSSVALLENGRQPPGGSGGRLDGSEKKANGKRVREEETSASRLKAAPLGGWSDATGEERASEATSSAAAGASREEGEGGTGAEFGAQGEGTDANMAPGTKIDIAARSAASDYLIRVAEAAAEGAAAQRSWASTAANNAMQSARSAVEAVRLAEAGRAAAASAGAVGRAGLGQTLTAARADSEGKLNSKKRSSDGQGLSGGGSLDEEGMTPEGMKRLLQTMRRITVTKSLQTSQGEAKIRLPLLAALEFLTLTQELGFKEDGDTIQYLMEFDPKVGKDEERGASVEEHKHKPGTKNAHIRGPEGSVSAESLLKTFALKFGTNTYKPGASVAQCQGPTEIVSDSTIPVQSVSHNVVLNESAQSKDVTNKAAQQKDELYTTHRVQNLEGLPPTAAVPKLNMANANAKKGEASKSDLLMGKASQETIYANTSRVPAVPVYDGPNWTAQTGAFPLLSTQPRVAPHMRNSNLSVESSSGNKLFRGGLHGNCNVKGVTDDFPARDAQIANTSVSQVGSITIFPVGVAVTGRLDGDVAGHLPAIMGKTRSGHPLARPCRMCDFWKMRLPSGGPRVSRHYCLKCKVPLCIRGCFKTYHEDRGVCPGDK